MDTKDPYSRLQYRRLIAWPKRIEREAPLLREVLGSGPSGKILDLGCGTGEHTHFLASEGYEVVGVDRSAELLEEARHDAPPGVRFVEADLGNLAERVSAEPGADLEVNTFGGAVCLGNTLPHLVDRDALRSFAEGVARLFLPGSPLLLQIVNYDRIFARNERHLPLNFRADPDGGEIVFLRLLELHDDGTVTFCPTSLRFRPDRETPVEVKSSRRVRLHGWRREELEEDSREAGFRECRAYGNFAGEGFVPLESSDLLLVAVA